MDLLRPLLALWILWTLTRVARVSWRQRALTLTLWRAVRFRHVGGALGLLVLVAGVASALIVWVPGADLGLGHLVGLSGNAVFAPLEEGLARAGPPPASGPDWMLLLGVTAFLGPLTLLLPWLAFVEEEVFRAGLEDAGPGRVVIASLIFGLAHLVMLVPLGAALAIGVAGAVYAGIYRHAFSVAGTSGGPTTPEVVRRLYRPTRRARTASARARWSPTPGPIAIRERLDPEERQAAGVFAAAVWHTTFNTMLVVLVWLGFVVAAVSPAG